MTIRSTSRSNLLLKGKAQGFKLSGFSSLLSSKKTTRCMKNPFITFVLGAVFMATIHIYNQQHNTTGAAAGASGAAILPMFHTAMPDPNNVTSKLANRAEGYTRWCQDILAEMKDMPYRAHRKQWEYCFMAHALEHFDKLQEGKKGIGFAVGSEPLATYFVKKGVQMTVSDMPVEDTLASNWANTNQHAAALKSTFRPGIVDFATYEKKATFTPIDMNKIPEELMKGEFDFTYSSSSLEHVGSVELGREFILNAMKTLKKGGIAVHTTELAINSFENPGNATHMSVWLKKDVDLLAEKLAENGCRLFPMDYSIDILSVDEIPYSPIDHFILKYRDTIHTSIAFVIEKLED
jgi:hypothetical protein